MNGGFFHSGAAFQPAIWGLSVVGFGYFVEWLISWRNWQKRKQVFRFFWVLAISICVILSLNAYLQKNAGGKDSGWNQSFYHYQKIEVFLSEIDKSREKVVMVNNPPGYFVAVYRPAIVIPFGDVNTLLAAGKTYHAKYVVLENRNPYPLKPLYDQPQMFVGLKYLGNLEDTKIFEILD
jgi:hypothetical protein